MPLYTASRRHTLQCKQTPPTPCQIHTTSNATLSVCSAETEEESTRQSPAQQPAKARVATHAPIINVATRVTTRVTTYVATHVTTQGSIIEIVVW